MPPSGDSHAAGLTRIGKYDVRGILGRGAMGTVYDGWDPLIARRVAIKTVSLPGAGDEETSEQLARFRREAQAAGRLHHPHIVGVFDYGETGEFAYIIMEFVDGRSLKALLDGQERLPLAEIVRIMEELLAGLAFSHAHGVVHRDIKPANIILTNEGEGKGGRVKIGDFGIARIESSSMTQAGTIMGTPAYMSPEQFTGTTVDLRTDIYSAGVVLYQMLTGEKPFDGSMTTIMHKVLNSEPLRPSELSVTAPASFDAVVARAMARRPEQRFANAEAFAAALRDALANPAPAGADDAAEATIVRSGPRPAAAAAQPTAARKGKRRLPIAAGLGVLAVATAGIGLWQVFQYRSGPLPAQAPEPAAASRAAPAPETPAAPQSQQPPQQPPSASPEPAAPQAPAPVALAAPTAPAPPPETASPSLQAPAPAVLTPPVPAPALALAPAPAPKPAPPPQQQALATPPALPQKDVAQALRHALQTADCTLAAESIGDNNAIAITGFAASGAPEQALKSAVRQAAPGTAEDWRLATFSGPYCDGLNALRPAAANGLMALHLPGNATRLRDGQLITPTLVLPAFPAHLRVDYLSHDGSVFHMYPTPADPDRVLPPGTALTLGDPQHGGARWEVGPPYGTDMIVAVASSDALLPGKRPESEDARGYLNDLRAALESALRQGAKAEAGALILQTASH